MAGVKNELSNGNLNAEEMKTSENVPGKFFVDTEINESEPALKVWRSSESKNEVVATSGQLVAITNGYSEFPAIDLEGDMDGDKFAGDQNGDVIKIGDESDSPLDGIKDIARNISDSDDDGSTNAGDSSEGELDDAGYNSFSGVGKSARSNLDLVDHLEMEIDDEERIKKSDIISTPEESVKREISAPEKGDNMTTLKSSDISISISIKGEAASTPENGDESASKKGDTASTPENKEISASEKGDTASTPENNEISASEKGDTASTPENNEISASENRNTASSPDKNDISASEKGDTASTLKDNDISASENDVTASTPDKGDISAPENGDATATFEKSDANENSPTTAESKNKRAKKIEIITPPRRSSRNLNKKHSYSDDNSVETMEEIRRADMSLDDDDEIREIKPRDPLAGSRDTAVIVNNTKSLAKFAATSHLTPINNKKEPTLVIIDTNSLLSGKGAIPLTKHGTGNGSVQYTSPSGLSISYSPALDRTQPPQNLQRSSLSITATRNNTTITPIGGGKSHPPPIKPILVAPPIHPPIKPIIVAPPPKIVKLPSPPPTPEICNLTDDMWVVEAPSFIVPYVYEKPGIQSLKEFISSMEKLKKDKEDSDRKAKETEEREKSVEGRSGEVVENRKEDGIGDDVQPKIDTKNNETAGKENQENKITADARKLGDNKPPTFFDSSLGKFFTGLGLNLVQESVQSDLLRSQKRKCKREGSNCAAEVIEAIETLTASLQFSQENNAPFKTQTRKCELCSYRAESRLALAYHMETPHMKNYTYRCNFCPLEVRSPHDILYHMEAEHNVHGRLERAPAYHQCPNCPFEDNLKGKLTRHTVTCLKRYRPEKNQEPPIDWDPPAKIPKQARPQLLTNYMAQNKTALYQAAMANGGKGSNPLLPKLMPMASQQNKNMVKMAQQMRPTNQMAGNFGGKFVGGTAYSTKGMPIVQGNSFRNINMQHTMPQQQAQMYQMLSQQGTKTGRGNPPPMTPINRTNMSQSMKTHAQQQSVANKLMQQQPSISITPLPRANSSSVSVNKVSKASTLTSQSSLHQASSVVPKGAGFVVCEICDGYIKDLEQLRNHMLWIHKVKIHPKMIYNRPPLNCQKCQFRFFTDQGLERHLLGSHGLVTSSMQEAANKGKDGGRCPICGRVYQWKLLNHVARDHNLSLKPAHLSYKCTVCTATFSMYKEFETHVYSAHSLVAQRALDKKSGGPPSQSSAMPKQLQPLKINDEITIIPQPARILNSNKQMLNLPQTSITKLDA